MLKKWFLTKNMFYTPFSALKEVFREGYGRKHLGRDIIAGLTVGVIADRYPWRWRLPVVVAPQHGLYTAIVAGIIIGAERCSRFNISGPTALCGDPISGDATIFGLSGLLMATRCPG